MYKSLEKFIYWDIQVRIGLTFILLYLLISGNIAAQNFWETSNGPFGGTVKTFAYTPSNGIFIGTEKGGIFRSNDDGISWTYTGLRDTTINSLTANSNGYVFAGTENESVFRSTDYGQSWIKVDRGLKNPLVSDLITNSKGDLFVALRNRGGIFCSTDNGEYWISCNDSLESKTIWAFAADPDGDIYVITLFGVIHHFRNMMWIPISDGFTTLTICSFVINSSGDFFVATKGGGIYRLTNGGENWESINNQLTHSDVRSLTIKPNGDIFAGTNGGGIFRSKTNGDIWEPVNTGLTNLAIYATAISPSGDVLAGTKGNGAFRLISDIEEKWTLFGPSNTTARSLAINSRGEIFSGISGGGAFYSTDGGKNWTLLDTSQVSTSVLALAVDSEDNLFTGTDSGLFLYTQERTRQGHFLENNIVQALVVNANDTAFAGTDNGVFRSARCGNNWEPIGLQGDSIQALEINRMGVIFAGTANSGVLQKKANETAWTQTILTDRDVRALGINPVTGYIFAGTGIRAPGEPGQIFCSIDNGLQWDPVHSVSDINILALGINASGHIFAGTDGNGILRSKDNGDNWPSISQELTNPFVPALAVAASGRIFLGSEGSGVFFSSDSGPPRIENDISDGLGMHGEDFPITFTAEDDIGLVEITLNYREGGESSFITEVLGPGLGNNYVGTIPANVVTSRGTDYYFMATDSFGNEARLPEFPENFSIRVRIEDEVVRRPAPQHFGSNRNDYRLFSVPFELDNKSPLAVLEDDLGTQTIKTWRFFELISDSLALKSDILTYNENPESAQIIPGKAFWLIVADSGKSIGVSNCTTNSTQQAFPITLLRGWNFIGNPFNFDIHRSKTTLKSSCNPPEYRFFSGSWLPVSDTVDFIRPFEGYAVFNDNPDIDTLFIDPNLTLLPSFPHQETRFEGNNYSDDEATWHIRIIAQCQGVRDVDNIAKIAAEASPGRDNMDIPEPPVIGEYVSLYFPHRNWETLAKTYCVDARPEPTEGEEWEFEVKTNIRDKITLDFENLENVPENFGIWLIDQQLKITQNLRDNRQYFLAGTGKPDPRRLKLIVGSHRYLTDTMGTVKDIPSTFELFQNYPNPFNPVTTIRYGLPRSEKVKLVIYNALGQKVATLVNDIVKEAGYHAFVWDRRDNDGRQVASGVYIYQIRSGSFIKARKLILVK